jgi:hypothetical protein
MPSFLFGPKSVLILCSKPSHNCIHIGVRGSYFKIRIHFFIGSPARLSTLRLQYLFIPALHLIYLFSVLLPLTHAIIDSAQQKSAKPVVRV